MVLSAPTDVQLRVTSTITDLVNTNQEVSSVVGTTYVNDALTGGVDANQARRTFEAKDVTISSGVSLLFNLVNMRAFPEIDIGAGSDRDALGQTTVLSEIVLLLVKQTAGPGRLEINDSGAQVASWIPVGYATVANGAALRPGGIHLWYDASAAGFPVSGAAFELWLKANGGDVTCDILVVGRDDVEASSSSTRSVSSTLSSSSSESTQSSSPSSSSCSLDRSASTQSTPSSTQSTATSSTATSSTLSSSTLSSSTISTSTQSTPSSSSSTESTHSSSSCSTVTSSTATSSTQSTMSSSSSSSP